MSKITTKDEAEKTILDAISSKDIDTEILANHLNSGLDFCICVATSSITVKNISDEYHLVSVSKTCNGGGSDGYYEIAPGETEKWTKRCVANKVTIRVRGFNDFYRFSVLPTDNDFILNGGEIELL